MAGGRTPADAAPAARLVRFLAAGCDWRQGRLRQLVEEAIRISLGYRVDSEIDELVTGIRVWAGRQ